MEEVQLTEHGTGDECLNARTGSGSSLASPEVQRLVVQGAQSDQLVFSDDGGTLAHGHHSISTSGVEDHGCWDRFREYVDWHTFLQLWALAWPVVLTYLATYSTQIVTLVFLGHKDKDFIAGAALGTMLFNVTGASVGIGLLTAMDTLCSQAYGARNLPRVGLVYQRAVVVMSVLVGCVAALWLHTESLLLSLHQPPVVAHLAGQFTRLGLGALWPLLMFESLKRFLQSQRVVKPMLLVAGFGACCHPLWCYLFIWHFDFGFVGAPCAMITTNWLQASLLSVYTVWRHPHEQGTWAGLSWEALQLDGMHQFMRLGLPGAAMLCLEWWAFEFVALGAGWLGTDALSVHNILATYVPFAFMVPLGIGVAANTRVGNELGAGREERARKFALVALFGVVVCSLVYGIVFLACKDVVGYLFTTNEAIASRVAALVPAVAFFMVIDGFQGTGQGVLRGAGLQKHGAVISLVGFYLVSLPCAFAFAFALHWSLAGLWWGMILGYIVILGLYLWILARIDWTQARIEAQKHASAHHQELSVVDYQGADDSESDGAGE